MTHPGIEVMLAELERLEAAATKGPWAWKRNGRWLLWREAGMRDIVLDVSGRAMGSDLRVREDGLMVSFDSEHPDAAIIASSRNALPVLLKLARLAVEARGNML